MEKRFDHSEKMTRSSDMSIEQASDGILWVDATGRIYRANRAICELLGYTEEELTNLTVSDFDPDYPPEKIKKLFAKQKRLKRRNGVKP